MDTRNPTIIHPPIEGENLTRARRTEYRPSRWDFAKFIAVACLIGLAWFVLCAMGWRVAV